MRLKRRADHEQQFRDQVRTAVVGLGRDDTKVRDAQVALVEDVAGFSAWRVTLVLPRPRGETWNVDETLDLQDEVRRLTNEIADDNELEMDGLTSVVITTDQARAEDIAVDDEPEPDERSDADDGPLD